MASKKITGTVLTDLLIVVIKGFVGGSEDHWREIIGPIHILPVIGKVASNWHVVAGGTAQEREIIAHAVTAVRQAHPIIRA